MSFTKPKTITITNTEDIITEEKIIKVEDVSEIDQDKEEKMTENEKKGDMFTHVESKVESEICDNFNTWGVAKVLDGYIEVTIIDTLIPPRMYDDFYRIVETCGQPLDSKFFNDLICKGIISKDGGGTLIVVPYHTDDYKMIRTRVYEMVDYNNTRIAIVPYDGEMITERTITLECALLGYTNADLIKIVNKDIEYTRIQDLFAGLRDPKLIKLLCQKELKYINFERRKAIGPRPSIEWAETVSVYFDEKVTSDRVIIGYNNGEILTVKVELKTKSQTDIPIHILLKLAEKCGLTFVAARNHF